MWDELETVIDDVLHQFDRRAVKKFLKRDIDGNTKNNLGHAVKEVIIFSVAIVSIHTIRQYFVYIGV